METIANGPAVNAPNTTVDLVALKAAVGTHFFVWSQLERALTEAIDELGSGRIAQKRQGISQTAKRWKQLQDEVLHPNPAHEAFIHDLVTTMSEGLDMRNKIAHGIVGWSVKDTATIETKLNGKQTIITYAELNSMNEQLATLKSHLSRVTSVTLQPKRWHHTDLYTEVRIMLRRNSTN